MDEKTTTVGPITIYAGPLPADASAASTGKVIAVIPAVEIGKRLDCTDPGVAEGTVTLERTTTIITRKRIFPKK